MTMEIWMMYLIDAGPKNECGLARKSGNASTAWQIVGFSCVLRLVEGLKGVWPLGRAKERQEDFHSRGRSFRRRRKTGARNERRTRRSNGGRFGDQRLFRTAGRSQKEQ